MSSQQLMRYLRSVLKYEKLTLVQTGMKFNIPKKK